MIVFTKKKNTRGRAGRTPTRRADPHPKGQPYLLVLICFDCISHKIFLSHKAGPPSPRRKGQPGPEGPTPTPRRKGQPDPKANPCLLPLHPRKRLSFYDCNNYLNYNNTKLANPKEEGQPFAKKERPTPNRRANPYLLVLHPRIQL